MSPPPWTTTTQLEFLLKRREDYARAQDSNDEHLTLTDFRNNLHQDFFALWPNEAAELHDRSMMLPDKHGKKPPAPRAIASEQDWIEDWKKKLVNWFNNHPLGQRVRVGGKPKITISLNAESSRVKSEKSIYSSIHYADKVKPTIDISILNSDKRMRLANINQEVSNAYENESEDVKANIQAIREDMKVKKQQEREVLSLKRKVGHVERSPKEYALAIESLPEMVSEFFTRMGVYMGWSFTVLAGGPDPTDHGEIATLAVHSCENMYGSSFGKVHPDFNEAYLTPYSNFIKQVYHASRALIPRDTTADAGPSSSKSPSVTGTNDCNQDLGTPQDNTGANDHNPNPGTPHDNTGANDHNPNPGTPRDSTPSGGSTPSPENLKATIGDVNPTAKNDQDVSSINTEPAARELFNIPPLGNPEPYLLTQEQLNAICPLKPTKADSQVLSDEQLHIFAPPADILGNDVAGNTPSNPMHPPQASDSGLDIGQASKSGLDVDVGQLPLPQVTGSGLAMPTPATELPNIVFGGNASNHGLSTGLAALGQSNSMDQSEKNENTDLVEPRRIRKVLIKQPPIPLTATSEAVHKWFDDARTYLSNDDIQLGSWEACIATWVTFEKENGSVHMTSNRLPGSSKHPDDLAKWVPTRKYSHMPKITDPVKFTNEWVHWWNSIQPQWRCTSEVNSLPLPLSIAMQKQNISSLKKMGPSGIVIVLTSLKWWYMIQGEDERWERAVDDIHECLKAFMSDDGKRKVGEGREDGGPKKKQKTKSG